MAEPTWFAVIAKPSQERTADAELRRQGYGTWLPLCERLVRIRAHRTARGVWIEGRGWQREAPQVERKMPVSLWPGYLFACVEEGQPFHPITSTRGVRRVMGSLRGPQSLSERMMAEMYLLAEAGGAVWAQMSCPVRHNLVGHVLDVLEGPFAGHSGLCEEMLSGRVKLALDVLGRKVPILLPTSSVKAPEGASAAVAFPATVAAR